MEDRGCGAVLIELAVAQGDGMELWAKILIGVMAALNGLVLLLNAGLKKYVEEKATHLATKEDLVDLVKEVKDKAIASKEGEIHAIHSELATVIEDARRTREATARIEATISLELWDRQKQWELKKETFFKAIDELAGVQHALMMLNSTYQAISLSDDQDAAHWNDRKLEASELWSTATRGFDKATLLSSLVCGKEVLISFKKVDVFVKTVAVRITQENDLEFFLKSYAQLLENVETLISGIRKELGVDALNTKK